MQTFSGFRQIKNPPEYFFLYKIYLRFNKLFPFLTGIWVKIFFMPLGGRNMGKKFLCLMAGILWISATSLWAADAAAPVVT